MVLVVPVGGDSYCIGSSCDCCAKHNYECKLCNDTLAMAGGVYGGVDFGGCDSGCS